MVTEQTGQMMRGTIRGMLRAALRDIGSDGPQIPEKEVESLTDLCLMGIAVTGQEDPRDMLRKISDPLLEHVVENREAVRKNEVIGKLYQMFLVEWCYRHGHLKGDWLWQWESAREGRLSYNPKVPLDQVEFPDPPTQERAPQ